MITSLNLTTEGALKNDAPQRIEESGAYIGTIVQAEVYECRTGTIATRLVFKTTDGIMCFLSPLFIQKADGTEIFGKYVLDAIGTVLDVTNVQIVPAKCKDSKGQIIDGFRMKALENKPIGMLIQMEHETYWNTNKNQEGVRHKSHLRTPFDPATRRNAREIIEQTDAQYVEKRLAGITDIFSRDEYSFNNANVNTFESTPRQAPVTTSAPIVEDYPF